MSAGENRIRAHEHLQASHDVSAFDSGVPVLDEWLKKRALANEESGASRTCERILPSRPCVTRSTRSRLRAFNRGEEPVASPYHGFDVGRAVLPGAERLSQPRDRLDDAVVGDGDVPPRPFGQLLLGNDDSGVGCEEQKHVHLPNGKPHGFRPAVQGSAGRIQLEWTKTMERALGSHSNRADY
jgi:hypothetical protein